MIKLIAFDLDGTLAPAGKPITKKTLQTLKQLEQQGKIIVICSGKPVFYLCGLIRQLNLESPIIIGENGLEIQWGIDLPPNNYYFYKCSEKVEENLHLLKKQILELFNNKIWSQTNRFALTFFPDNKNGFDKIRKFLKENESMLDGLSVYEHSDCFDILPNDISKKEALQKVGKLCGLSKKEICAVGDGVNDYPMFASAGTTIGINLKDSLKVTKNFKNIDEAMEYIKTIC